MGGSTSGYPVPQSGGDWIKARFAALRMQIGEVRSLAQDAARRAGSNGPALPDPITDFGANFFAITAAAETWQPIDGTTPKTFGVLERPLMVKFMYFAVAVASTSGRPRLGLDISGGYTLAPAVDQASGKDPATGLTPWVAGANGINVSIAGAKIVTLPAGGSAAMFRMVGARSLASSSPSLNFAYLIAEPIRWK